MQTIKVAGIDPSLTHTGIAIGNYIIETGELVIERVRLIETEKDSSKQVRRNSDDLVRCEKVAKALYEELSDRDIVFSEIPTGAQSARAAFSFGMVIGLLAGVTASPGFKPVLVQVLPQQVKLSIPGGSKVTSKEEIIEWAVGRWPDVNWTEVASGRKYKVAGHSLGNSVEHPADACAAINAGIQTTEFANLKAFIEKIARAA